MKKILLALALILTLTSTAYGASYVLNDTDLTIKTNGKEVACTPLILHGMTYLPLRTLAESIGAEVNYNAVTKQVDIKTLDTDKLAQSCVMLEVSGGQGSGVYTDYGEILTCEHVISDRTYYKTSDGLNLTLDSANKTIDASILSTTDKSVKPVKIGDSDEIKQDDILVCITSPMGKKNQVSVGAAMDNCTPDTKEINVWLETDHGSSGGAVFNMKGELVGIINSGDDTREGAKCSGMIPINQIRKEL